MKTRQPADKPAQGTNQPRVPVGSEYLSLRDLSQYAGLSVRKLRDYLHDRVRPLPSYRIGGRVPVRRADFDVWALQFRVVSAATTVEAVVDDIMSTLR